jgi:iron complex outermembrane receptor protein
VNGATQTAIQAGFPDWQRARWTINLGAGYTFADNKWRIEGWVSNLLNTEVSQKAIVGSGLDVRFLNDARTYGIRGRYTF